MKFHLVLNADDIRNILLQHVVQNYNLERRSSLNQISSYDIHKGLVLRWGESYLECEINLSNTTAKEIQPPRIT